MGLSASPETWTLDRRAWMYGAEALAASNRIPFGLLSSRIRSNMNSSGVIPAMRADAAALAWNST